MTEIMNDNQFDALQTLFNNFYSYFCPDRVIDKSVAAQIFKSNETTNLFKQNDAEKFFTNLMTLLNFTMDPFLKEKYGEYVNDL